MGGKDVLRWLISAFLAVSAFWTLCVGSTSAAPASIPAGIARFENISTEQGLSQSTVLSVLQDRQGFLWFGTEGGLDRYDGLHFTAYAHDPDNPASLSSGFVDSLFQDQQGDLWVGTSVGLDRFDQSTETFIHYTKDLIGTAVLEGKTIETMDQDQNGILWIGTDGAGLVELDLTTNKVISYTHRPTDPGSLSSDTVRSIYLDQKGTMWVGTDGGLDQFNFKTKSFDHLLQPASSSQIPETLQVHSLYQDGEGILWIGTLSGLIEWNENTGQVIRFKHDPNELDSLSSDAINKLFIDSQGIMWIGTGSGLNQFDRSSNHFVRYMHDSYNPYSLSSDYVRTIFEDRSGVLWIGTSFGGVNKYARSTQKFNLFNNHFVPFNNLSDNNVWSIYEDREDNLWIGTFFSGLNQLNLATGQLTTYRHDPSNLTSLSNDEIRAIVEDQSGALWVGTEHGGLNRFDPAKGTFKHYGYRANDPGSLSGDNVFSLYVDPQGRLWIGTEYGGLDRYDPATDTFIHYENEPGDPASLSDNDVRAIYEDENGIFWIGTFGGLDVWDGKSNHFTVYRHEPENPGSISSDVILSLYEAKDKTIWVGTFGSGLNRFDRLTKTFTHYTVKNGLPDDTVYGILADSAGCLWLSTNIGLSKFNPNTRTYRNYDLSDGLQGDQFNPGSSFQSQDGQMFFGGMNGVNAFYPNRVQDNPIPPPVVITAFKKFNQTIQTDLPPNKKIQLSYRDNFISFEFAALDFNAPDKNQYAYQLEGVDKVWVYTGTRNYASYTNLKPGHYTFRVKASNNDGIWSTGETTLRIEITPPFWQTLWFIGTVCLLVGGAAVGGYQLRVRDIEARNRALTRAVEQRTHELATLNTIASFVNRSLDLPEIMNYALDKTIELMHMDGGLAYRLEETEPETPEEASLRLLAHRGVSTGYADLVKVIPLRSSLLGEAAETGKPIIHLTNDHPDPKIREAVENEPIRMGISLPLLAKGRLVGAVSLAAHSPHPITTEELSLLAAIGQQVGIAVENARLYEKAEQTAILAERSRLARELHDSVTQLLYSVTLYAEATAELLSSGDSQRLAGHLRELRDTAQEALREMRLLIFELHRPALGKEGLAAALQARLDAVETRGGMQARMSLQGTEQISPTVQAELYNIAHEALNNVLKHAHASQVQVNLAFGLNETVLEIADNGVGFMLAPDGSGSGFGIPGMMERAQKIGGTLQVTSEPGKGTSVQVRVPKNPPDQASPAGSVE